MARSTIYDVASATRILPLVQTIVRDVVAEFRELRHAGRQQRILETESEGSAVTDRRLRVLRTLVQDASTRIEGYLRELEDLGLEIRDLESGLVDFPTIMRGEPAFLCWTLGENEVLWWHAAGQGFGERQRIPAEERVALASTRGR
jgi:hypothetical protein